MYVLFWLVVAIDRFVASCIRFFYTYTYVRIFVVQLLETENVPYNWNAYKN